MQFIEYFLGKNTLFDAKTPISGLFGLLSFAITF